MASLILNSLEIRKFRAFHDLKIDHLKRINLIVGKNNIGKSSLLEAIYLNTWPEELQIFPFTSVERSASSVSIG